MADGRKPMAGLQAPLPTLSQIYWASHEEYEKKEEQLQTQQPRRFKRHNATFRSTADEVMRLQKNDELPSALKHKLMSSLNKTSIDGIGNIVDSRSIARAIVWTILVLAAAGWMVYQCYETVTNFLAYETVVRTDIVYVDRQVFPAVTVCNNNPLQRLQVVQDRSLEAQVCAASGWYFDTKERHKTVVDYNTCSKNTSKNAFLNYLAKSADLPNLPYGIQKDRFVLSCHFTNDECPPPTEFVDRDFGNCLTYLGGGDVQTVRQAGHDTQLSLTLFADKANKVNLLSAKDAIHVVIHNPDVPAFPSLSGVDIPLAKETVFSVHQTEIERLPAPYTTNCLNDTDPASTDEVLDNSISFNSDKNIGYSYQDCRLTCIQRKVLEKMKCAGPGYPKVARALGNEGQSVEYCNMMDNRVVSGMEQVYLEDYKSDAGCGATTTCKPRCHERIYSGLPMTVDWPTLVEFSAMKMSYEDILKFEKADTDIYMRSEPLSEEVVALHQDLFTFTHFSMEDDWRGPDEGFEDIIKDMDNRTAFKHRMVVLSDSDMADKLKDAVEGIEDVIKHHCMGTMEEDGRNDFENTLMSRFFCANENVTNVNCSEVIGSGMWDFNMEHVCVKGAMCHGPDCPVVMCEDCAEFMCCFSHDVFNYMGVNTNLTKHLYLGTIWENGIEDVVEHIAEGKVMNHIENEFMRESLAHLVVHLENMQVEQIIHSPRKKGVDLVSDFGGSIGLFLGLSLVSMVEILEVIGDCFMILSRHLFGKGDPLARPRKIRIAEH